jgi:hypothetical protein
MGKYAPGTSGYRCPHCRCRDRQPGPRSFPRNQTPVCLAGSSNRSEWCTRLGLPEQRCKSGGAHARATAFVRRPRTSRKLLWRQTLDDPSRRASFGAATSDSPVSQKSYQNFSYTKLVSGWAIGPASHSPSRVNATAGELATWRAKRLFQQPWSFALLFSQKAYLRPKLVWIKLLLAKFGKS